MPVNGQDAICREANAMLQVLSEWHIAPRQLTASHTQMWLQETVQRLDDQALYWTEAEVAQLISDVPAIDSTMSTEVCTRVDQISQSLIQRLQVLETLIDSLSPLAYQSDLQVSDWHTSDVPEPATTWAELRQRWQASLQYATLRLWFQQTPDSLEDNQDQFLAAWDSLHAKACRQAHCALNSLQTDPNGIDGYVVEVALNALANSFDPHSMYFSPEELDGFEADLRTDDLTFGLELQENDEGEIEIARLTPGGPAWRSNTLNQGDVLISITPKDAEPVDLACANVRTIQALLDNLQVATVSVSVRKSNGEVRDVTLRQARMTVEENVISGFILDGPRKVGYIYLPAFYTNWEEADMVEGLTNDVAKELLKLRLGGIEGLILDLRYNGGGAMIEAIGLSGMFVDEGTISVLDVRDEEPEPMRDFYRGVGYDGPMVVMVNGLSASASEMFAAALQDYHRAVIVGDTTYGKSTGQVVLPLSEVSDDAKATGYLKVTNSRFYRVSGKSHQRQGVIPDVVIPDLWRSYYPRERDESAALSAPEIDPANKFTPLSPLPVAQLAQQSQDRLQQSEQFRQLNAQAAKLPRLRQAIDNLTLDLRVYAAEVAYIREVYQQIDTLLYDSVTTYQARNHPLGAQLIQMDEVRKERNERQLQRIQNNAYIEEAYYILSDLIDLE